MEAIILAGGKAERLGAAAEGRPKALVPIAERPLAAYQVAQLARAGVSRVLVSCAAGQEDAFQEELSGLGPEIVTVPEPEPLGRGGGLRLAAGARREEGDVYALNGDELLDVDLGALLARHRESESAATIVVTHPHSPSASSSWTATWSRASWKRACFGTGSAAASTSWATRRSRSSRSGATTRPRPSRRSRGGGGSPRFPTRDSG